MNKKKRQKPTRIAEALLRLLLPEREKHDLFGDHAEYYREIYDGKGRFCANVRYLFQIINLIRPLYVEQYYL